MSDGGRSPVPGAPSGGARPGLPSVPDEGAVADLRSELAAIREVLDRAGGGPAPRPRLAADPATRAAKPPWRPRAGILALLAALAVVLVVVAVAVPRGSDSPATQPSAEVLGEPSAEAGPSVVPPGTDVQVRLSGRRPPVVVETAVLGRPGPVLLLVLPDPAEVRSSRLTAPTVTGLQARSENGPVTVSGGDGSWTVTEPQGRPISRLTLRYRLDGAVVARGGGARALVVVTPLTARLSRRDGRPVVVRASGAQVREAVCIGAAVADQLCGSRTAQGWDAGIPASSPVPFVVLQVDLTG